MTTLPAVKTCTICHREMPLTAYANRGRGNGSLRAACRDCEAARYKVWRLANRPPAPEPAAYRPHIPIGPRVKAVRIPHRDYACCPRCSSTWLAPDEIDGGCYCIACGWREPSYQVVANG